MAKALPEPEGAGSFHPGVSAPAGPPQEHQGCWAALSPAAQARPRPHLVCCHHVALHVRVAPHLPRQHAAFVGALAAAGRSKRRAARCAPAVILSSPAQTAAERNRRHLRIDHKQQLPPSARTQTALSPSHLIVAPTSFTSSVMRLVRMRDQCFSRCRRAVPARGQQGPGV